MTIGDKTALMQTGLKPKRQVEPSELITERRVKLFNLGLYQNGSQRNQLKISCQCLIYRETSSSQVL